MLGRQSLAQGLLLSETEQETIILTLLPHLARNCCSSSATTSTSLPAGGFLPMPDIGLAITSV